MSEPYIGELRIVAFNYVPSGWALCDGQLLPVAQNEELFSIIGTMFGGDGIEDFGLPDFRGRVPMHVGNGFALGDMGGAEQHTLSIQEMPAHGHVLKGL